MLVFQSSGIKEIGYYAICGVIATMTDVFILVILNSLLKINYLWSAGIAFSLAAIVKFVMLTLLILKHYQRHDLYLEIFTFVAIALIGLIINHLIVASMEEKCLIYSKIMSIIMVVLWNFLLQKLFIFNKPRND